MAKKKVAANGGVTQNVEDYRHTKAKRKNNPPAKIAAEGIVPPVPPIEYAYSPRRPPVLRFDPQGGPDKLPELLAEATRRPLSKDEARVLAEALRTQEPWLEWAGKRESEAMGLTVDPVALNIHERVSAQAILKIAARQDVQRSLFGDPEQEYHEAVQFYKHDIDWTNRLILGDALQVMASLAHREDLAGKVQMIYIDPPYGIRYGSNFQPLIGNADVGEREADLSREAETVKAFRDTWHLGIHSYLAYLRDRLCVMRELLSPTGSIFVQIGEDNVHLVRKLLDDLFGPNNFCSEIVFTKTSGRTPTLLPSVCDYLLWYAADKSLVKYRDVYQRTDPIPNPHERYVCVETQSGQVIDLSVAQKMNAAARPEGTILRLQQTSSEGVREDSKNPVYCNGRAFYPPKNRHWSIHSSELQRVADADMAYAVGNTLTWKSYRGHSIHSPINNSWTDISSSGFGQKKQYATQTLQLVVERCMLMTTDPGDLVLDPTCGSGTTAIVAEGWGRRWVTIDTSRVAVSIARQRLLTSRFNHYKLKDEKVGPAGGFIYERIPYVTLGQIGRNTNLDILISKHQNFSEKALQSCNEQLLEVSNDVRARLTSKLARKQSKEGLRSITDADRRRWELPEKGQKWEHWTVPFDTDPDWPPALVEAVTAHRKAWRAKMDEVNACIAANAEQEELVDQPEKVPGIVRVSGPFTVEAVQPPELSLDGLAGSDGMFGGEPDEMDDTFALRLARSVNGSEAKNAEAYLDQMLRLLRLDGVRFPDNKHMSFSRLERVAGSEVGIQAEGRWAADGEADLDPDGRASVALAFGPQYGPVTAKQVEDVIRSANRRGYDDLVVAGFSFDGPAQAIITEAQHPRLRIHIAHIRPDVNPGMAGLLKEQPGSQLFTVFGQPRTTLKGPDSRGEYTVTMEGVDIYDPVTNTIRSTEDQKVAAWFLDGDYDGRTFCITQAFFPDRSAWDKLANALGGVVDPDRFEALSGTVSLPFPPGKHKSVAVKVIDPRGNEVMQVHRLA
jgi:adenine-specific DNA-methyltransferase